MERCQEHRPGGAGFRGSVEPKVFVSTPKVQKMRQMMTARNRKCSKQGSISGVCVEGIQGEKCPKDETLTILYSLSANTLTEKVSENPQKVQNVGQAQQVVAENKESGNPVEYFIKMLLKQCLKRNIMGIFIQRR